MVVFDIDLSPSSLRRQQRYSQETIDVTTTATTRTTAGITSSRTDDPTAVAQNDGASSSSPSSRAIPTVANHPYAKCGNTDHAANHAATTTSSISTVTATTTTSYSSLSSMETDDSNANNMVVEYEGQQQQHLRLPVQHQALQQQPFPQRRVVSFGTNAVTIIDDNPFLFTDYEKSVCFCSVSIVVPCRDGFSFYY